MTGRATRREVLRAGLLTMTGLAAGCGFVGSGGTATGPTADNTPAIEPKIDGDLVYFNWADYVDPAVLDGFAKEYGVKVTQANFDSMESMVAKLAAGNRYDIIFPSEQFASRMIKAGQLHRIDHGKLRNVESIFGTYTYFADPWYDPGSAHTIPNTMYKTGIGYRKDKLGAKLSGSWADLWDTRAGGRTFLLDQRDEVIGLGALRLGYDINTADQAELDRIVELVRGLRPRLRGFSSDNINNMLNGSAWMHQLWSGDIVSVVNQAKKPDDYGFESPREGAPTGSDCYAIPKNAAHPGTALLFIDYMLRPENVRKNVEFVGYPMPVKGSEDTYAKLVEKVPEALVTVEDLERAMTFRSGTQAQSQARDAAWTRIKAG